MAPQPVTRHPALDRRDLLLACVALAGTAAYVLSFGLTDYGRIPPIIIALGFAAAHSWLILGALLVWINGCGAIVAWMRLCLRTMAIGIAILSLSMILNVLIGRLWIDGWFWMQFHYYLLLGSDMAMGAYFVLRARCLGMSRLVAALLWLLVLNGACVLQLLAFHHLPEAVR